MDGADGEDGVGEDVAARSLVSDCSIGADRRRQSVRLIRGSAAPGSAAPGDGSTPNSSASRARTRRNAASASACRCARYSARANSRHRSSRSGAGLDEGLEFGDQHAVITLVEPRGIQPFLGFAAQCGPSLRGRSRPVLVGVPGQPRRRARAPAPRSAAVPDRRRESALPTRYLEPPGIDGVSGTPERIAGSDPLDDASARAPAHPPDRAACADATRTPATRPAGRPAAAPPRPRSISASVDTTRPRSSSSATSTAACRRPPRLTGSPCTRTDSGPSTPMVNPGRGASHHRLRTPTSKAPRPVAPGGSRSNRLGDLLQPQASGYLPSAFGARHVRSNGNRQACGAISWWMAFGPHDPGV